ncbi:hypothetical protein [Frigoribacterium sp. PvP032]|uniref:hypothetical protein n=1 Tax=Frigoribacterium sp. PvP032 TaxID=2806589 RepID=UPI001AE94688|nr:hypothetical protein [Frigoribacterium sp. PvP032]MBP1191207.1 hypothetical protein [Frigoribacterium sp. PvP032]
MSIDEVQTLPGKTLTAVVSPWTGHDARELQRRRAETVSLNSSHGFREPTLDLVRDLPATVTSIVVLARWIDDLTPLYDLGRRLTSLHLHVAPGATIDLSRLPGLTSLSADWPTVEGSLHAATGLDDLYLGHVEAKDLTRLSSLRHLRRLSMKDRPALTSLAGLDALESLRSLTVAGGRYLVDITDLAGPVGGRLEELDLDSCRHIHDLDPLTHCGSLTELCLANIGDVPSAAPLRSLTELRRLFLHESTRFLDGDLSAIAGLPHLHTLSLMNRRHYHPDRRELEASLASSPDGG